MAGIQHFYAYNHYTKLSVKNQQGFSLFLSFIIFCAIANDAKYLGVPWRAEWIQCSDNFIQFSEKLITLSVGNIMAAEFHFLKQFIAILLTCKNSRLKLQYMRIKLLFQECTPFPRSMPESI